MNRLRPALLLLLLACLLPQPLAAQFQYWSTYQQPQWFQQAARNHYDNRYDLLGRNTDVQRIHGQLQAYSQRSYPVYGVQTHTHGTANPRGWITLDIRLLEAPLPVLAFWLAHEWGHLAAPAALFAPDSTHEDSADAYAARFLARHRYPLEPLLHHLRGLPPPHDGVHRHPADRARRIAEVYATHCLPAPPRRGRRH